MKITVIGGAGMMGRVAVRDLAENFGAQVVIADRELDAARRGVSQGGAVNAVLPGHRDRHLRR